MVPFPDSLLNFCYSFFSLTKADTQTWQIRHEIVFRKEREKKANKNIDWGPDQLLRILNLESVPTDSGRNTEQDIRIWSYVRKTYGSSAKLSYPPKLSAKVNTLSALKKARDSDSPPLM